MNMNFFQLATEIIVFSKSKYDAQYYICTLLKEHVKYHIVTHYFSNILCMTRRCLKWCALSRYPINLKSHLNEQNANIKSLKMISWLKTVNSLCSVIQFNKEQICDFFRQVIIFIQINIRYESISTVTCLNKLYKTMLNKSSEMKTR